VGSVAHIYVSKEGAQYSWFGQPMVGLHSSENQGDL